MTKKTKGGEKVSEIVKPLTRAAGEVHALEELFDGPADKVPTLKSIGLAKIGEGNQWVSYVMTTKGREVMSIEVDEPNLKAIAEEASKINFVHELVDGNVE